MLVIQRSQRHNRSLFQFVLHFRCHLHFLATATRLSLALQRRIFQKGSNCGGTQESNLSPRAKVASDGYIANDKSMPLSKKKHLAQSQGQSQIGIAHACGGKETIRKYMTSKIDKETT
jgi:hypothetical protein